MDPLEKTFRHREAELIAALNGWDDGRDRPADILQLRDALQAARKACLEAGIEVEDIWTRIEASRAREAARLELFIEEQMKASTLIPARRRVVMAIGAAVISTLGVAHFVPAVSLLGVIVIALGSGYLSYIVLADLFATPAVRIAREAARIGADKSQMWPHKSLDAFDYRQAYRVATYRLRRKDSGAMIRVR